MALWAKVQQLGIDTSEWKQSLYGDHFPIQVRHCLAEWIEKKFLGGAADLDSKSAAQEQYIKNIVEEFIAAVESTAQTPLSKDQADFQLVLRRAAQTFRQISASDPLQLYRNVRNCLARERFLVEQMAILNSREANSSTDLSEHIAEALRQMKHKTQITADMLENLEQFKGSYANKFDEIQTMSEKLFWYRKKYPIPTPQLREADIACTAQIHEMECELGHMKQYLVDRTNELEGKIAVTINELEELQNKVLKEELARLKKAQLNHEPGMNDETVFNAKLDTVQVWCEGLAESIWKNRQQLKDLERLKQTNPSAPTPTLRDLCSSSPLIARATELLSTLVSSAFVILKQPYQVLKTKTRFPWYPSVRLLVCHPLGLHMNPPTVTASIINEEQVVALYTTGKQIQDSTSGEIGQNSGKMKYTEVSTETRRLYIHFGNMRLKKIQRGDRTKTEFVTDDKFCLRFKSSFVVGEEKFFCDVLSCPVVVIVNVSQEAKAWATIMWDNSFSEPGRSGFEVPQQVSWFWVSKALSNKFETVNGRGLSSENLQFLGEKLFLSSDFQPHSLVNWSQFCKDTLPTLSFTFWDWFYATLKLTHEHLLSPWVDGRIIGFVRKKTYESMLEKSTRGTFLLRFSDSKIGSVTISWNHGEKKVRSLEPFTSKELDTKCISQQILDLSEMIYLFPRILKDVFCNYAPRKAATTSATTTSKYEKRDTKTIITTLGATWGTISQSPTQGLSPSSQATMPLSPFSVQSNSSGFTSPPPRHESLNHASSQGENLTPVKPAEWYPYSSSNDVVNLDAPDALLPSFTKSFVQSSNWNSEDMDTWNGTPFTYMNGNNNAYFGFNNNPVVRQ